MRGKSCRNAPHPALRATFSPKGRRDGGRTSAVYFPIRYHISDGVESILDGRAGLKPAPGHRSPDSTPSDILLADDIRTHFMRADIKRPSSGPPGHLLPQGGEGTEGAPRKSISRYGYFPVRRALLGSLFPGSVSADGIGTPLPC